MPSSSGQWWCGLPVRLVSSGGGGRGQQQVPMHSEKKPAKGKDGEPARKSKMKYSGKKPNEAELITPQTDPKLLQVRVIFHNVRLIKFFITLFMIYI